jgi:hypothetical protein
VARRPVAAAIPLLIALSSVPGAAGQAADTAGARAIATRTIAAIRLDAHLDDQAWQQAPPTSRFVQREPVEGSEPSEDTDVRVLYTDDALYIDVLYRDRSSSDIISTQLTRDVDDRIMIVLDPFFDPRNGFFFELNPSAVTTLRNQLETWSFFTAPFNLRRRGVVVGRLLQGHAVATRARRDTETQHARGASVEAERNGVDLPQRRFFTQILTVRADYNFTQNTSWANLTQYDSESRIAGLQSRFRWILQPGDDLFLVLNRGWYRTLEDHRFEPIFDRGSAKLQYTFRF